MNVILSVLIDSQSAICNLWSMIRIIALAGTPASFAIAIKW